VGPRDHIEISLVIVLKRASPCLTTLQFCYIEKGYNYDADTDTDIEADTYTDIGIDINSDIDVDTNIDADIDMLTCQLHCPEKGYNQDADTHTHTHTDTDADADTDIDADRHRHRRRYPSSFLPQHPLLPPLLLLQFVCSSIRNMRMCVCVCVRVWMYVWVCLRCHPCVQVCSLHIHIQIYTN